MAATRPRGEPGWAATPAPGLGSSVGFGARRQPVDPFKGSISAPQTYYTLDLHPLFAQDFLDLYAPAHLVQAYRFEEAWGVRAWTVLLGGGGRRPPTRPRCPPRSRAV